MLNIKDFLVFTLPYQWVNRVVMPQEYEWARLNWEMVNLLFSQERRLWNAFSRFLATGSIGIVFRDGQKWISYAWMSLPETLGPSHLPYSVRKLPVYWIFYCRTKEEYRGRGLYKASLSLLASFARERNKNAQVFIDTSPDNIPSRRAIEAVGFQPQGIITTWNITLPRIRWVLWGRWDREAPHPPLLPGRSR